MGVKGAVGEDDLDPLVFVTLIGHIRYPSASILNGTQGGVSVQISNHHRSPFHLERADLVCHLDCLYRPLECHKTALHRNLLAPQCPQHRKEQSLHTPSPPRHKSGAKLQPAPPQNEAFYQ